MVLGALWLPEVELLGHSWQLELEFGVDALITLTILKLFCQKNRLGLDISQLTEQFFTTILWISHRESHACFSQLNSIIVGYVQENHLEKLHWVRLRVT